MRGEEWSKSPALQDEGAVGEDLDAGAYFCDLRCGFEDSHFMTGKEEGNATPEATEAGADDDNLFQWISVVVFGHIVPGAEWWMEVKGKMGRMIWNLRRGKRKNRGFAVSEAQHLPLPPPVSP